MSLPIATSTSTISLKRGRLTLLVILLLALAAGLWFWLSRDTAAQPKKPDIVPVVSGWVIKADLPVRLSANATVTALRSVDVRAQISATIKTVHIKEGQYVSKGDPMFSLDARTEDANLGKSEAQLAKSRADLANAERNLQRQTELFTKKFISQTALDVVQNQFDSLHAQVAADRATVEATRVARSFSEIVAPISGRTGVVAVYPGSLVQPNAGPLVTITQIDPINVSFTLPEGELPALQKAFLAGDLVVEANLDASGREKRSGHLTFVDNSVDSASGTIRLKASFDNSDGRLWPGMFTVVTLSPRTLNEVLTVPAQAIQTGPEDKFLYVIGDNGKTTAVPVRVLLVQDGIAAIEGVAVGNKVVLEGAQNLRPGSSVNDTKTEPAEKKQKKS